MGEHVCPQSSVYLSTYLFVLTNRAFNGVHEVYA